MRKRLWVVVPVALLLVLGIGAFWQIKKNRAEAAIYAKPDLLYGVMIKTPSMKRVADQRRETIINYAKMLREKWRPWVEQHRALFLEAKNSNGSEQAAQKLYDAIPDGFGRGAKRGDITDAMLMPDVRTVEDLTRPDMVICFTWNMPPHEGPTHRIMKAQREDFARERRFRLSSTYNAGRATIYLWTDGSITETVSEPNSKPGEPSLVDGTPLRIMPPYEFLQ